MTRPLVSIVMPVRDGLPYLQDCLDSIIAQSYSNWELHVVNDHSKDNTAQILEAYALADNRIIAHTSNGKGIIDALRLAYVNSSGKLITRMDADDLMPADKLALMVDVISKASPMTIVTGDVEYFSHRGISDGYKRYQDWLNSLGKMQSHWREIYKECVIASPCWMMHRTDFEAIGAFKSDTYPEDYDLCFRMYQHGCSILHLDKTLHHWRDHDTRASRNDEHYSDNRFLDLKLRYYKELECTENDTVIVVGAGKKGKFIAKSLRESGVKVTWVTNNRNKIGHKIYGITLEEYHMNLFQNHATKVIIAIANREEQSAVFADIQTCNHKKFHCFC